MTHKCPYCVSTPIGFTLAWLYPATRGSLPGRLRRIGGRYRLSRLWRFQLGDRDFLPAYAGGYGNAAAPRLYKDAFGIFLEG